MLQLIGGDGTLPRLQLGEVTCSQGHVQPLGGCFAALPLLKVRQSLDADQDLRVDQLRGDLSLRVQHRPVRMPATHSAAAQHATVQT